MILFYFIFIWNEMQSSLKITTALNNSKETFPDFDFHARMYNDLCYK